MDTIVFGPLAIERIEWDTAPAFGSDCEECERAIGSGERVAKVRAPGYAPYLCERCALALKAEVCKPS